MNPEEEVDEHSPGVGAVPGRHRARVRAPSSGGNVDLTSLEKRWKHMYGPQANAVGSSRVFGRRVGRVSETERQICDLRRNVTHVDRRICAKSMGITEGKFMVRFEEALRRARKRVRDVESFEVQLGEFFMAIAQMKVCLGEWTQEEIDFNRESILENAKSLSEADVMALRKLYDQDSSLFMGESCVKEPGVELRVEGRATRVQRVSSWLWSRWDECLSFIREAFSKEGRPPQSDWIEERVTEERRDVEQEDGEVVAERRRLYFMDEGKCDPRFGVIWNAPCVMSATVCEEEKFERVASPTTSVCGRTRDVIQMALMLKKKYELPQKALTSKARNYEMRIIDSGCGRTVVNDYNMLSGNIVSCNAKLGGIDPSQNVREQLQAAASGALELKLMHKGKSTKVTVENAMYVPGLRSRWSRRGI